MSCLPRKIWNHLPLIVVIAISLFIAFKNIDPTKWYTGWDNVHGEFDVLRYAKQVLFGSWLEHQGTGAPMSLGHLSEVFRLPILLLLKLLLPDNLVRYVFIFSMYVVGGISMYYLLLKSWIKTKDETVTHWLAALGAVLYLLHVLTLQQFYISFELFTIQFAYLPLLLLSVGALASKTSLRNILLFLGLQLLIAPTGHTPTLFYLGALMSVGFAFFKGVESNFLNGLKVAFLVGTLTFVSNAYWIIPNFYFAIHDSHYVSESRENRIFGPESLWSIKESGTISNFLKSTHYLMTWKDYSFTSNKHEFIFNDWQNHLANPVVSLILMLIGFVTVSGAVLLIIDRNVPSRKWAILLVYLFCVAFIWIDLLPTGFIVNELFKSKSFLETFRNPFTKLSVIYSAVSVLLFVHSLAFVLTLLRQKVSSRSLRSAFQFVLIGGFLSAIVFSALPSFQGHFLSEKLQVQYPKQYQELFKYLKGRDPDLRILQLPQLSHAGWEYYDWQFLGAGNGYQGMGFVFFGFPQPLLNRDSDRWVETSDFFYHELKFALDSRDPVLFSRVANKYNVDLVLIDKTRIEPGVLYNLDEEQQLAMAAGFTPVWSKDFIAVYERTSPSSEEELLVPEQLTFVNADTSRVRKDVVYEDLGNYVVPEESTAIRYPFSNMLQTEFENVSSNVSETRITQPVPSGVYSVSLPGLASDNYFTPAHLTFKNDRVSIVFPKNSLVIGEEKVALPQIADIFFDVPPQTESLVIFFNNLAFFVEKDESLFPVIKLPTDDLLTIEFGQKPTNLDYNPSGTINVSNLDLTRVPVSQPNWRLFKQGINIETAAIASVSVVSEFPTIPIDLLQNNSLNCSDPERGTVKTDNTENGIIYTADSFGVNCNGHNLSSLSPTYSYLMNVKGENVKGRGIKFFVNYFTPGVLPEDFLLSVPQFNSHFVLLKNSNDPLSIFNLNWETRSLGKNTQTKLDHIKVNAFPLLEVSSLKLTPQNPSPLVTNSIKVRSSKTIYDFIHLVDFECASPDCYLGLDQSYDDGWIGFQFGNGFRPHLRLNNWANLWLLNQNGKVMILYWPALISLSSLALLLLMLGLLGYWYKKTSMQKPRRLEIRSVLVGKRRRKL